MPSINHRLGGQARGSGRRAGLAHLPRYANDSHSPNGSSEVTSLVCPKLRTLRLHPPQSGWVTLFPASGGSQDAGKQGPARAEWGKHPRRPQMARCPCPLQGLAWLGKPQQPKSHVVSALNPAKRPTPDFKGRSTINCWKLELALYFSKSFIMCASSGRDWSLVQRCVPAWFATGTAMCSFFWMPEPGGPGGLRRQVSGERKEPRGVLYLMRNDNPRQPGLQALHSPWLCSFLCFLHSIFQETLSSHLLMKTWKIIVLRGMKVLKGWLPACATADMGDTFNIFSWVDSVEGLATWWQFVCVGAASKPAAGPWVIAPVSLFNIKNKCMGGKPCLLLRQAVIFRTAMPVVIVDPGARGPWHAHLRGPAAQTLPSWPGSRLSWAQSLGCHISAPWWCSTENKFLLWAALVILVQRAFKVRRWGSHSRATKSMYTDN